jgi:glutaredoxin
LKNIILFSSGCPKCKVLKQKLDDKQIKYEVSEDFDELILQNLQTVPVLKVDGEYYQFGEAIKLIGELV